ncbi:hypothetical protein LXL04_012082 [Taraxacum kok-saghyz]
MSITLIRCVGVVGPLEKDRNKRLSFSLDQRFPALQDLTGADFSGDFTGGCWRFPAFSGRRRGGSSEAGACPSEAGGGSSKAGVEAVTVVVNRKTTVSVFSSSFVRFCFSGGCRRWSGGGRRYSGNYGLSPVIVLVVVVLTETLTANPSADNNHHRRAIIGCHLNPLSPPPSSMFLRRRGGMPRLGRTMADEFLERRSF